MGILHGRDPRPGVLEGHAFDVSRFRRRVERTRFSGCDSFHADRAERALAANRPQDRRHVVLPGAHPLRRAHRSLRRTRAKEILGAGRGQAHRALAELHLRRSRKARSPIPRRAPRRRRVPADRLRTKAPSGDARGAVDVGIPSSPLFRAHAAAARFRDHGPGARPRRLRRVATHPLRRPGRQPLADHTVPLTLTCASAPSSFIDRRPPWPRGASSRGRTRTPSRRAFRSCSLDRTPRGPSSCRRPRRARTRTPRRASRTR